MINTVQRIGTEETHDGWFLINGHVQVRYLEDEDGWKMDIDFDDTVLTEKEAQELAEELLRESIKLGKSLNAE